MIRAICLVLLAAAFASAKVDPKDLKYLGPAIAADGSKLATSWVLVTQSVTWDAAFNSCVNDLGGVLVAPVNPTQNNELRTYMVTNSIGANIWIGARRYGSTWSWTSKGVNMLYANWHATSCSSSADCGIAYHNGPIWGWCSLNCNSARQYVCEF